MKGLKVNWYKRISARTATAGSLANLISPALELSAFIYDQPFSSLYRVSAAYQLSFTLYLRCLRCLHLQPSVSALIWSSSLSRC